MPSTTGHPSNSSTPASAPPSPAFAPQAQPAITPPEEAWVTMAAFLVVVGIVQWGSVLYAKLAKRRRQPPSRSDEESTHTLASTRPPVHGGSSLARLPVVALNVFRVVLFRWTIELGPYELKVVDILLTLAYIGFLFGWTFTGAAQQGVTSSNIQTWADQAGQLAASQFPLVTVLGTKNNVVSVITGISYEKLNFLHRVTARSCFLLLLFHAGGQIYNAKNFHALTALFAESFVRLGLTAVSALAIILIVAMRPIRTRLYEVFFYTHFIAVFIFLLAAYFHTNSQGAGYWIWPCFMFWALDRLLRVARIVVANHLYCSFSRRGQLQDATTELLSDDFIRVRVRRPAHFQWSPGQTAYLTMPSVSTFPLEAHPFSISTIDSALFHPGTRDGQPGKDDAQWKELVFLINVRNGFTKRLRDVAAQRQTVKMFIDGPYGCAPDMAAYDTSIFVAGGSGITYTLPVFLNVIEASRKRSSRCRRVVFIWAVRDASHLQWISDALYRANALTPTWLNVSIRIFATRGDIPFSEGAMDPERTPDKEGSQEWAMPPSVRIEKGRPDIRAILRGEVSTATGSLSVTVCGSQSLTRSVRHALRFPVSGPTSILNGGPSVTLHVESFGYA